MRLRGALVTTRHFRLLLCLALLNALLAFMTATWEVAIVAHNGYIVACVNCLHEGVVEVLVLSVLLALGVATLADVILLISSRPEGT